MKKTMAWLLLAAVLLSACGTAQQETPSPVQTPVPGGVTAETSTPETVEWNGEGRPYRQQALPSRADSTVSLFAAGDDYYSAIMYFAEDGRQAFELLKNGEELIYAPADTYITCASGGDEGIWLLESVRTELGYEGRLHLIGYDSESLRTLAMADMGLEDTYFYSMRCFDGGLCLQGAGEAAIVDEKGDLEAFVTFDTPETYVVTGGDEALYAVSAGEASTDVCRYDSGAFMDAMELGVGGMTVFGGNSEFLLTGVLEDGLYGISADGSLTPLVIWEECRVSVSGLRGAVPLSQGRFLLLDAMGTSMLSPTDPAELKEPVILTIATLGEGLYGLTYEFNTSGTDYFLEEVDYSSGGTLSTSEALTRLSADIAAGNAPDMFLLSGMPVNSWIRQGYLADIMPLIEADPGFDPDDIVILEQLSMGGGFYYLDSSFGIDTYAALESNVGDALGWTPEEYLAAEAALPAGSIMMYNMTKDLFFEQVASRYMQQAIDWQSGSCDFDNEEFIALLESTNAIRETPEPEVFTGYVPAEQALREGTEYAVALWVGNVTQIKEFESLVGEPVSVVGMPTPDGECGSRLMINSPVGIYAGSAEQEGCWEFLKFLLMSYDMDYHSGANSVMPAYRPYFDAQLERAANEGDFSSSDAQRLWKLIEAVDCTTLYDETALGIMKEEALAYFSGIRSAEKAAEIIQSRLSIYVAEQG